MLVLSRKIDERVLIEIPGYPDLVVCVTGIAPNRVELGFEAPENVHIYREELLEEEDDE